MAVTPLLKSWALLDCGPTRRTPGVAVTPAGTVRGDASEASPPPPLEREGEAIKKRSQMPFNIQAQPSVELKARHV